MSDLSYFDIYKKRLNRYGNNYQTRTQNKREREFENYLLKSVYRIDFTHEEEIHPATFEKYKQDETATFHYLLTRTNLELGNGTILMLPSKNEELRPWMVYYLEDVIARGYNRYILLKMTHLLTWKDREGNIQESWAYFYGQEDNMLKDELQARSRADARYTENLKGSFFIMPLNKHLKKDDYLEIGEGELKEGYRVTGFDIQSTLGVEYVTVDPVYLYDESPDPIETREIREPNGEDDFFWLRGGSD